MRGCRAILELKAGKSEILLTGDPWLLLAAINRDESLLVKLGVMIGFTARPHYETANGHSKESFEGSL